MRNLVKSWCLTDNKLPTLSLYWIQTICVNYTIAHTSLAFIHLISWLDSNWRQIILTSATLADDRIQFLHPCWPQLFYLGKQFSWNRQWCHDAGSVPLPKPAHEHKMKQKQKQKGMCILWNGRTGCYVTCSCTKFLASAFVGVYPYLYTVCN